MEVEFVLIYSFFIAGLGYSIYKDRQKTRKACIIGGKMLLKMIPGLLFIVGLVGLLLGFVPPEMIEHYLGKDAGFGGTLLAAAVGAITFIPSLVSLPLAGSLLRCRQTLYWYKYGNSPVRAISDIEIFPPGYNILYISS
ncbi:MAG: hypothetical protein Q7J85_08080 [Bacillota bacterium]|nr:hypothetical protein [Bacillota bacterium]